MEQAHPGTLIRDWRIRRRLSQLALAADAEISQRHLSFIESGRARPSREMTLHLAAQLDMPLRERNELLLAAGFAPNFGERRLDAREFEPAMKAVELVLSGHEPNPAIAVDRHWNLLRGNRAIGPFLRGIADPALLAAPINVLRLSLHPQGLAPRIANFPSWRAHLLHRLARQNLDHADPALRALEAELRALPAPVSKSPARHDLSPDIAVPLQLDMDGTTLSFISTITVFGTPLDVTLSELAVESFFAADEATAAWLKAQPLGPTAAA